MPVQVSGDMKLGENIIKVATVAGYLETDQEEIEYYRKHMPPEIELISPSDMTFDCENFVLGTRCRLNEIYETIKDSERDDPSKSNTVFYLNSDGHAIHVGKYNPEDGTVISKLGQLATIRHPAGLLNPRYKNMAFYMITEQDKEHFQQIFGK